jgi:putative peptide zinc metalloprotease protein
VPLPFSVKCSFEVQPRGSRQVYSPLAGQIKEVLFRPGSQIREGEVLLQLGNADLEYALTELEGRYKEAEEMVSASQDQRFTDPSAADQLQMQIEMRDSALRQWQEQKAEFDKLTIIAPTSGTIIPPASRKDKMLRAQGRLPSWEGTPFDARNKGALVEPTDLICQIGDPEQMEAVLVIDQAYIDLVEKEQPVRVLFEAYTRKAYDSQIEEIAVTELKVASPGLSASAGGRLETKTDASGQVRPLNTSYQARVPLVDIPVKLQTGMQGQARIYTGWQPLGRRLYRYCAKTFHFDL